MLVFVLLTCNAVAQINYGDPPSISSRLVYQTWSVKSTSGTDYNLDQWYFPVYGYLPIEEDWEVRVTTASAGSRSDSSGNQVSITGLNDTRISALHSLLDKSLLIGIGLNIPTGKTKLDPEQLPLGRLLTADFFDLPAKRYGEGLGLYLEGAFAHQFAKSLAGIAMGYLLSTSYSPVTDVDDYNAGNRFTISGNLMRSHSYGRAYLYIRYNIYATSKQNGFDVHKTGAITEMAVGTSLAIDEFEGSGGLRLLLRQADSRLVDGVLRQFEQNNYGSDLRFFSSLGYRMEDIGKASILIDYKKVASNGFSQGNDEYVGESNLFSVGIQFERAVNTRFLLGASIKAHSGSGDDGNLDLSGYEVSLIARASL